MQNSKIGSWFLNIDDRVPVMWTIFHYPPVLLINTTAWVNPSNQFPAAGSGAAYALRGIERCDSSSHAPPGKIPGKGSAAVDRGLLNFEKGGVCRLGVAQVKSYKQKLSDWSQSELLNSIFFPTGLLIKVRRIFSGLHFSICE